MAADPPKTPSSRMPGTAPQTTPAMVAADKLVPVISTAGAEPKFGVQNAGAADSKAGAELMIGCVPVNAQATGNCKLKVSNDAMADPGNNKVAVPVLKKGETKWYTLAEVPGAAPAKDWLKGGYNFTLSVAGNKTNSPHTWNKP